MSILNPIMLSKAYLVPLSKGQLCTFSLSSTCAERLNNVQEMRSKISKPEFGFILSGSVQNVTENNGEEFPHCFRERERDRRRAHTLWFLVDLSKHAPIPVLGLVYALEKGLGKRKMHCKKQQQKKHAGINCVLNICNQYFCLVYK